MQREGLPNNSYWSICTTDCVTICSYKASKRNTDHRTKKNGPPRENDTKIIKLLKF